MRPKPHSNIRTSDGVFDFLLSISFLSITAIHLSKAICLSLGDGGKNCAQLVVEGSHVINRGKTDCCWAFTVQPLPQEKPKKDLIFVQTVKKRMEKCKTKQMVNLYRAITVVCAFERAGCWLLKTRSRIHQPRVWPIPKTKYMFFTFVYKNM